MPLNCVKKEMECDILILPELVVRRVQAVCKATVHVDELIAKQDTEHVFLYKGSAHNRFLTRELRGFLWAQH